MSDTPSKTNHAIAALSTSVNSKDSCVELHVALEVAFATKVHLGEEEVQRLTSNDKNPKKDKSSRITDVGEIDFNSPEQKVE